MKAYGGGCMDPYFLDLGTSWRWMVIFTSLPLYLQVNTPGTHWIGGCVDPRASLDGLESRKFLPPSGLELRPLGRPARSQSLYRLLSLCSKKYTVYTLKVHLAKWGMNGIRCKEIFRYNKQTLNSHDKVHCLVLILPRISEMLLYKPVLDEQVIRIKASKIYCYGILL
jgi:hypothetical protein